MNWWVHTENNIDHSLVRAAELPRRPKVYFEEWDDPADLRYTLGFRVNWTIAGGDDVFPELAVCPDGKSRIIADPEEVIRRAPDIIIGSWCGKKFRPEKVAARQGWDAIPAVQNGDIYEIKSAEILQPGPAALTDGLDQLQKIIGRWSA